MDDIYSTSLFARLSGDRFQMVTSLIIFPQLFIIHCLIPISNYSRIVYIRVYILKLGRRKIILLLFIA